VWLRLRQRARADPPEGPEIVVVEGGGANSDQNLSPAGERFGNLDDLEVAERVVAAIASGANGEHGSQR